MRGEEQEAGDGARIRTAGATGYNAVMMTVEQIKSAIEQLPLEDRAALAKWLHGWADDEWDRQMREDHQAGRLNRLLEEARRDIRAGRVEEGP